MTELVRFYSVSGTCGYWWFISHILMPAEAVITLVKTVEQSKHPIDSAESTK